MCSDSEAYGLKKDGLTRSDCISLQQTVFRNVCLGNQYSNWRDS